MNEKPVERNPAGQPEAGPCERCGNPNAEVACGGHTLCLDCYYLAGSCCLEFGADDLWREVEAAPTAPA